MRESDFMRMAPGPRLLAKSKRVRKRKAEFSTGARAGEESGQRRVGRAEGGGVPAVCFRLVDAREKLGLSYRQIKRLWRRYRQEGPWTSQTRKERGHFKRGLTVQIVSRLFGMI